MLKIKVTIIPPLYIIEPVMSREIVILGNWKMHMKAGQARAFIEKLKPLVQTVSCKVYIAPPFTSIHAATQAAKGSPICIGAQNMSPHPEGAYTGEISSGMIQEAGALFLLVGHSERRLLFGEEEQIIKSKVKRAAKEGIETILCVGETKEEHESGRVKEVLGRQLETALEGVSFSSPRKIRIAYEPVWAIGSGKTATPEIAQMAHKFCRICLEKRWGSEFADQVSILYGGSVNVKNVSLLAQESDVDGVLVGGASLNVDLFAQVIQNVEEVSP